MSSNHLVLIVGSGSVGKRHARNLASLGCRIACVDPREDRLLELQSEVATEGAFSTLEDALASTRFDAAVICSPPSAHVDQAIACLDAGLAVLLEKPVAPTLEDARKLAVAEEEAKIPIFLGYTWRWWPPLERVREMVSSGEIGSLRHVRFVMSAHLADWHPWERYQDFFMARQDQGGGALLDESHWIDLCCWLFGMPNSILARVEKISDLEIDSDDNVDMLLEYPGGLRVSLHLDLFGRPHEKSIVLNGDSGSIHWTADPNQLVVGRGIDEWMPPESYNCERNDMFVAVATEFLDTIAGAPPRCTLKDGINVLRIVEAARQSSLSGRAVSLADFSG